MLVLVDTFSYVFSLILFAIQVKDLHAYLAVASNTSGSTSKVLFEDVAEDLGKQVR